MPPNQESQKRYPPELKERAVRMVLETIEENGGDLCILAPGLTARTCRLALGLPTINTIARPFDAPIDVKGLFGDAAGKPVMGDSQARAQALIRPGVSPWR
jgi:hypothetical protein